MQPELSHEESYVITRRWADSHTAPEDKPLRDCINALMKPWEEAMNYREYEEWNMLWHLRRNRDREFEECVVDLESKAQDLDAEVEKLDEFLTAVTRIKTGLVTEAKELRALPDKVDMEFAKEEPYPVCFQILHGLLGDEGVDEEDYPEDPSDSEIYYPEGLEDKDWVMSGVDGSMDGVEEGDVPGAFPASLDGGESGGRQLSARDAEN